MGKTKSVEARRRQRRKQKLAKRMLQSAAKAVRDQALSSESHSGDIQACDDEGCDSSLYESSWGSPGSPPPTPSTCVTSDPECCSIDKDLFDYQQFLPPSAVNMTKHSSPSAEHSVLDDISLFDKNYYRERVDRRDRDIIEQLGTYSLQYQRDTLKKMFLSRTQTLHKYREKIDSLQLKINEMSREYKEKIEGVRSFWRDAIFNEHCRSGTILKAALHSSNIS